MTIVLGAWAQLFQAAMRPVVGSLAYRADAAMTDHICAALMGMSGHEEEVADLLDTRLDDRLDQVVRDEVLP